MTHTSSPRVVGIGASAGGLEALQRFFAAMPPDSGLAFVVVQHLSPDYRSLMAELLSRHTTMKVVRAEPDQPVAPNTVYLIPPRRTLTIVAGCLQLSELEPRHNLHLPIDTFFRSLAEDQGERCVAIVLSGTGSDGTRGIRAIKEVGGLVIVQDEASARFSGMPGSAIATGLADLILAPEAIPAALLRLTQNLPPRQPGAERGDAPEGTPERQLTQPELMGKLLALLRRHSGIDFAAYKPATIERRLERRMGIAQVDTLEAYLQYLYGSQAEQALLTKDLLIGVTRFFRDPEAFDLIAGKVIPELFRARERQGDTTVRVWVTPCSTGEEAYTLAILLQEARAKLGCPVDFKIFATDVDPSAIEVASAGRYAESIAADVPPALLAQHFVPCEGGFQVSRSIRERVIFATQNILKDPPFTRLDLVSCRNLLIYLQVAAQERLMGLFHFALRPEGALFLGSSETIGDLHEAFDPVDSKWRVYRKRATFQPILAETLRELPLEAGGERHGLRAGRGIPPRDANALTTRIEAQLLQEHVPSCLAVDAEFGLVHTYGPHLPYLRLPAGKASLNVLRLVPRELSLALATALARCQREGEAVYFHGVRFAHDGETHACDLRVERVPGGGERPGGDCYLVFVARQPAGDGADTPRQGGEDYSPGIATTRRIAELEQELHHTRENLQATIEELETSNEELQATNEELIAANEELQSTNEELESVNEELHTVNSEYQNKILELTDLNADMDNLLAASDVGIIFLDSGLLVRRTTPAVAREIPLRPTDIGRPLRDISHPFVRPILEEAAKVVATAETTERVVRGEDGRFHLMRAAPYQVAPGQYDGVLVSLVDITAQRRDQEALVESGLRLKSIFETVDAGICVTDEHGCFAECNPAYERLYGYTRAELLGKPFTIVVPEAYREAAMRLHDQFLETGEEIPAEWTVVRKDGTPLRIAARAALLRHADGRRSKVTFVTDLTALREAEEALAKARRGT